MRARCNCKNNGRYKYYGGRGISVCSEWDDYEVFEQWALSNGYDEKSERGKCTLDRIDNNGNYEPSNCRWVDMSIQSLNRRPPKFPSMRKPVAQVDSEGNVIAVYEGIQIAAEATGCEASKITAVCRGKRKSTNNMRWRYVDKHMSQVS